MKDVLARLSLYLLVDSSPAFTPLLRSLLTPETIPNTLIVILLDWAEPWLWLRQLKDWVRLLRILLVSLSPDCKAKMEEVMIHWRDRGKTPTSLDNLGGTFPSDGDISLPLGPGEWEEALGLPLCVVCQNVRRVDLLTPLKILTAFSLIRWSLLRESVAGKKKNSILFSRP